LRIKEQETQLTLHERDDDDDDGIGTETDITAEIRLEKNEKYENKTKELKEKK
jgi:hypothetical protein